MEALLKEAKENPQKVLETPFVDVIRGADEALTNVVSAASTLASLVSSLPEHKKKQESKFLFKRLFEHVRIRSKQPLLHPEDGLFVMAYKVESSGLDPKDWNSFPCEVRHKLVQRQMKNMWSWFSSAETAGNYTALINALCRVDSVGSTERPCDDADMSYCSLCGRRVLEGYGYCDSCFEVKQKEERQVPAKAQEQEEEETGQCRHCENYVCSKDVYCNTCGEKEPYNHSGIGKKRKSHEE